MNPHPTIDGEALRRALTLRDLSDPAHGPHAMQHLLGAIVAALRRELGAPTLVHRAPPLVSVRDNYDRLGYPPDGAARDARYTRYVTPTQVLRTQTSAMLPPLLDGLGALGVDDALLVCPGLVYRRDQIDRQHVGEPHQVDLWRIGRGSEAELEAMIDVVVRTALPGARHRTTPTPHPYTDRGRQIDAWWRGEWIEVGECGLASPALLRAAGLPRNGLAMGLGLDRLLMLRKGVPDIRLLRARDLRVAEQMLDLEPYREVSRQPAIRRDLSIAVTRGRDVEELGDRVREALGADAEWIETVDVAARHDADALPRAARERIGLSDTQENLLLRVILRHPTQTLTRAHANALRDRVYAAVHEGSRHQWAAGDPNPSST